jgi:hypothetical protein
MKRTYPGKNIDICLITVSEADLGVRALSSFLKTKDYTVCAGFLIRGACIPVPSLKVSSRG